MKKIFRRLACCSLLSIASIGCLDAEARLPKYMAQRAAVLLIERSGLVFFKDETDENREQKRMEFAEKLVDFLYSTDKRQHLANWINNRIDRGQIKTGVVADVVDTVNHFTGLFNEIGRGYNDNTDFRRFINQRFPCWSGTLTCFILNDQNTAKQILSLPADRRIQDVYWKYKDGKTTVDITSRSISASQKIIHVLFLLELIDTWNDVKKITDTREDAPIRHGVHDPYDCVPVPNTIYKTDMSAMLTKKNTQGSCMISTIRNLLCILCRNKSGEIELPQTLKQEITVNLTSDLNKFVAGTTNPNTLTQFVHKNLPSLSGKYEPSFALFISSLMIMMPIDVLNEIDVGAIQHRLMILHGLESEWMGRIKAASFGPNRTNVLTDYSKCNFFAEYLKSLTVNEVSPNNFLSYLFTKITGHEGITVTFNQWPTIWGKKAVTGKNWPEYQLIITDPVVKKKITIGLGHSGGGGQHIEIIDIANVS